MKKLMDSLRESANANLSESVHQQLDAQGLDISEFDALSHLMLKQNYNLQKSSVYLTYALSLPNIQLGILECNPSSDSVFCSHSLFDILGISDDSWEHNFVSRDSIYAKLKSRSTCFIKSHEDEEVFLYRCPDFSDKWLRIQQVPYENHTLYVFHDISTEVSAKERILHDRDYDELTNLYNRRAFARELTYYIDEQHCTNGVLSIWDLDNLKYANDTYGHEFGDKYICSLAQTLKEVTDYNYICARLAGDEFTLFLYGAPNHVLIEQTKNLHASFMKKKLTAPDGSLVPVSASAGFSCFDEDAITYRELLKFADFAMYRIKKSTKGDIAHFQKDLYIQNQILGQGIGELDRILTEKAIRYSFQPIVALKDKKILGYEAFIRPVSDLLNKPDYFLLVAKNQSKLQTIEYITWFHALNDFFQQLHANDNAVIFLNSIPHQMLSSEEICALESVYKDSLSRVVLEVHDPFASSSTNSQRKKDFCAKWKIPMALNYAPSGDGLFQSELVRDCGYMKIDKRLIHNIHQSPSSQALLYSIVSQCHASGIKIIAEGVESIEEYQALLQLDIDYGQGYYFGKPQYSLYDDGFEQPCACHN